MRKRALLEKGENISHQHCSEEHRHGQTPAQCISHRPDVNRRGAAQDRYDRERHLDAHEGDRQRQGAHSHLVEDAHCAGIPMNCDVSRAIFFGKTGWNIVAAHCQPSRACRRGMLPRARRPCFWPCPLLARSPGQRSRSTSGGPSTWCGRGCSRAGRADIRGGQGDSRQPPPRHIEKENLNCCYPGNAGSLRHSRWLLSQ